MSSLPICIGRVRHDPSLIPSGPRVYLFDFFFLTKSKNKTKTIGREEINNNHL